MEISEVQPNYDNNEKNPAKMINNNENLDITIRSVAQLKEDWNNNASYYANNLEVFNTIGGIAMVNAISFKEGMTILEVGCGSGCLSCYLLQTLSFKCTIISIDLSDEMIKLANARKNAISYDKNLIIHEFRVGNAEDLNLIGSETIDVYISPLCLHIVTDPLKMLHETNRVLKKNGKFALSVLGRKERCNILTIFQDAVNKVGIISKGRNTFRYGERQEFINLIREGKLSPEVCWHTYTTMNIRDSTEYITQINSMISSRNVYELLDDLQKKTGRENNSGEFQIVERELSAIRSRTCYLCWE